MNKSFLDVSIGMQKHLHSHYVSIHTIPFDCRLQRLQEIDPYNNWNLESVEIFWSDKKSEVV